MQHDLPISEQYRLVSFESRFIPEPNSGCWLWEGMKQQGKEYGLFCFRRKTMKAHRASWEIYCGPIPDGMNVLHRCDVPACVNPDHLFLGTQLENIHDRHSKGRSGAVRGELSHLAKLSSEKVSEIRARAANGESPTKLSIEFGISRTTMHRILKRKMWSHV